MRPVSVASSALVACCFVSSCLAGSERNGDTRTDSAGVTIVENAHAALADSGTCQIQVSDNPILELGVAYGDSMYQFFRVGGLTRMSNGSIIVVNTGTHELRHYAANGQFVRVAGGFGAGPGEFTGLTWIRRVHNDSIVAYDERLNRISVYDSSLSFVRSLVLPVGDLKTTGHPIAITAFEDGTYLASSMLRPSAGTRGLMRPKIHLLRFQSNDENPDTVGVFLGDEFLSVDGIIVRPHFKRTSDFVPHRDFLYVAYKETYEIEKYSRDGRLLAVFRKPHENKRITEAHLEVIGWPQRLVRSHATMPALGSLIVDPSGNMWVLEYAGPGEDVREVSIFDPNGEYLCVVRLTDRFQVLEVGDEYILGLHTAESGVERVQMYRLSLPRTSG